MHIMEVIWGIPLFLNCLPNEYPDIHHVLPSVGLVEPNLNSSTINLDSGQEFLSLPLEERTGGSPQKKLLLPSGYKCASKEKKRKEKKKINQSKIGGKQKKNRKRKKGKYRKVLWTRQCLNNVQNCQKEKEKKKQTKVCLKPQGCVKQSPPQLPTKPLCTRLSRVEPKRKEKKKTRERPEHPKAKFPTKIQLPKSPMDP